jgi:hypothetical protein
VDRIANDLFVALQVMMVEQGARNPVPARKSLEDFSDHLLKIPLDERLRLINGFCCRRICCG